MTAPAKAAPMREDVTQADRDFAAQWIVIAPENAKLIRAGEWDHHEGVQAARMHRLSHTARPDADMNWSEARDFAEFYGLPTSFVPNLVTARPDAGDEINTSQYDKMRAEMGTPHCPICGSTYQHTHTVDERRKAGLL
ncbi:hypothetical protein [Sphingomonas sp. TREG-RG-20F-R18-01]|uniref:hypothetical protein n=1 Tax=Sphingomonas sp. TREG-RG-20F-R18-01 TaxID=2914982 RepID=UPI001F5A036D|nr:hypothetical protein [Sphingomonas sp. TREG-RG-20F-R18-01]